jgi:hypothetical protein
LIQLIEELCDVIVTQHFLWWFPIEWISERSGSRN